MAIICYKPCSFKNVDSSNISPEAFSWHVYTPKGFALMFLEFVSSCPLDEVATVCPFFMRESMEKGGKLMLARQIRVAPSSLVAAFLSMSRWKLKSTMAILINTWTLSLEDALTFIIGDINKSPWKWQSVYRSIGIQKGSQNLAIVESRTAAFGIA